MHDEVFQRHDKDLQKHDEVLQKHDEVFQKHNNALLKHDEVFILLKIKIVDFSTKSTVVSKVSSLRAIAKQSLFGVVFHQAMRVC